MRRRALKRPVITKFWNEKTRDKTEGEKIELFYVFAGNLRLTADMQEYELYAGDVILTDFGEKCDWKLGIDGLMVQLSVDYFYICSQTNGKQLHFFCNSIEEEGDKYNRLKQIIQKMAKEYIATERYDRLKYTSLAYQLLLLLAEEFSDIKKSGIQAEGGEDARLSEILSYVSMNYDQDISLTVEN